MANGQQQEFSFFRFLSTFRRRVVSSLESLEIVDIKTEIAPPRTKTTIRRTPVSRKNIATRATPAPVRKAALPDLNKQPELRLMWLRLRATYFPELPELDKYSVRWTRRKQRRTLASCNVFHHRVSVSHSMLHEEAAPYLEPLLYHEMCHAALGIPPKIGGRRRFHGREFKALERLHPGIKELDRWIKAGGWSHVVRSTRARDSHQKRALEKR